MAITPINVGATANDTTGDPHRTAFTKTNANFADVQTQLNGKATTAQGAKADTAVQPARTITAGSGLEGGGDLSANRTLALTAAALALLELAGTALQPGAIGTTIQGYDADLAAIAALAKTDGNFIVANGTAWVAESGSTARSSLGLGTAATAAASSFATSAQGTKADSAVQPARAVSAGTGLTGGGDLSADRTIALSSGSQTSLGKADTAVQPAGGLVYVNHGATAGTTRPAGAAIVYWFGSVEPSNGVDGDLWYDTSGGA